jgi:DNA-binding IclR family transcriptional regulator
LLIFVDNPPPLVVTNFPVHNYRTIVRNSEPMSATKQDKPTDKYIVPAVEQALRVLFLMAKADSAHMSLTEIWEKPAMHNGAALCTLHTLKKYGIVQSASKGKGYTLGPGLIGLSRRFLDTLSAPKLAEPLLANLARAAGATAALGILADKNVFLAAKNTDKNIGICKARIA